MDTTIIIPQFHLSALTCRCLQSLRRHEPSRWPIIVVDDGSGPAERTALSESLTENSRLVTQRHQGVTAAWNTGIALATTPYVLLMNNDVVWQGPAIDSLLHPLRERAAMIVGAAWRQERDWPTRLRIAPRPLLEGHCLAFARRTWKELGGFDTRLALYYSDTDFQLRCLERWATESSDPLLKVTVPLRHAGHRSTRLLAERRLIWRRDRQRFLESWT